MPFFSFVFIHTDFFLLLLSSILTNPLKWKMLHWKSCLGKLFGGSGTTTDNGPQKNLFLFFVLFASISLPRVCFIDLWNFFTRNVTIRTIMKNVCAVPETIHSHTYTHTRRNQVKGIFYEFSFSIKYFILSHLISLSSKIWVSVQKPHKASKCDASLFFCCFQIGATSCVIFRSNIY